jgi:hypothetical protein
MMASRRITIQTLIVWLIASLGIGVLGYHYLANFDWYDSLLNASMILGGMGPMDKINNNTGKVFASAYAIYCGVFFLLIFAFIIDMVVAKYVNVE